MSRNVRIYKLAQSTIHSDDIEITGKGLAEIVRFLFRKIPFEKRPHSIISLKKKITELDPNEMASKKSPDTASIGQSITFIKTVLNGQNPGYIRGVLYSLIRNL